MPSYSNNQVIKRKSYAAERRAKKLRDRREYRRLAHEFVTDALIDPMRQWCPVAKCVFNERILVSQCHHFRGRLGRLLIAKQFWLAVSDKGHRFIHDHIGIARKLGWIAKSGDWNKQP